MTMSCDDVALLNAKLLAFEQEMSAFEQEMSALKAKLLASEETVKGRSLNVLKTTNNFVFVDRTASAPHCASKTHMKSKLESKVVALQALPDSVWNAPYTPPAEKTEVTVDSEAMVVARVVEIIQALITGLGSAELVHVATNRIVAGVELDIVLLFGSQRIPFAAIEVKKSGIAKYNTDIIFKGEDSSSLDLSGLGYTTGQHLDQLNAIGLFGFQSVFGMITNGNKWMLTSTTEFTASQVSNSDRDLSQEWNLESVFRTKESSSADISPEQNILSLLTETPCVPIASAVTEGELAEGKAAEEIAVERDGDADGRILYASQVVGLKEANVEDQQGWESVLQLIAKFLRLASDSYNKIDPRRIGKSIKSSCRVLDLCNSQRCSFEKKTFEHDVVPGEYLSSDRLIYLVASIGRGSHGDCCLGLSADGKKYCAVKFFLKIEGEREGDTPIARARSELKSWENVYGKVLPKCRVGELPNDGGYLCMPYLQPIPMNQRSKREGEVKEALIRFAKTLKYKHNDVRWRHFGSWEGKLYMCDLGNIEKVEDDEGKDIDEWVAASMLRLVGRMGATDENHSAPTNTTPLASSDETETAAIPGTSSEGPSTSKRKRG
jgi:hypothetical protein